MIPHYLVLHLVFHSSRMGKKSITYFGGYYVPNTNIQTMKRSLRIVSTTMYRSLTYSYRRGV